MCCCTSGSSSDFQTDVHNNAAVATSCARTLDEDCTSQPSAPTAPSASCSCQLGTGEWNLHHSSCELTDVN
jgi:hypothetical protein